METGVRVPVKAALKSHCWIDANDYQSLYQQSLKDSVGFWRRQAQRIDWMREPLQVRDTSFHPNDVHIRWFQDGELNASVNCIDRHLAGNGDGIALYWEADEPGQPSRAGFAQQLRWGQGVGRTRTGYTACNEAGLGGVASLFAA